MPTAVQEVSDVIYAIDHTDKRHATDVPILLGGRYVERADWGDAAVEAFYPPGFL